jgi:MDMPI C-terminal domain
MPPNGPGSITDGVSLRVLTTDTSDAWLIEARDARLQPRRDARDAEDAACTVSGPAAGVYLYLWNRADAARAGVTITGDPGLLSAWQASVRVTWG